MLALLPTLAATAAQDAHAEPAPFLKSSGIGGFLAEEEAAALDRRKAAEGAVRDELDRERAQRETEARSQQRGLCVSTCFCRVRAWIRWCCSAATHIWYFL